MLNQVVLVGRLTEEVEFIEENKIAYVVLSVPRAFKNSDGEYETDFVRAELPNTIATNTKEYCHKGDIIGLKGRLQGVVSEEDGNKKYSLELVADKVTFLSSKASNE